MSCLITMSHKATGKLLHLRFAGSENTFDDTIEAANAYAPEFMADFNARFGKPPRNPKDMHRPLADHENLDGAMCRKEVRTLSQALTLRYDKVLFILDPTEQANALAGKKVVVCDYPDGRLEIMHESFTLPYRTFDKLRSVHRSEEQRSHAKRVLFREPCRMRCAARTACRSRKAAGCTLQGRLP